MIVNGYRIEASADLRWADLSGACLREADLTKANLIGANLTEADLSGADLTGANLTGADLSGADLSGSNLFEANLTEANLTAANLTGSDLRGANLRGARLIGAEAYFTNLHIIQFSRHFGFIHEKILVIGCKTLELKDVNRKILRELGKEHDYTNAEIRYYSGVILLTKKFLDEGVIQ